MSELRREELDTVREALENGAKTVHVYGQPGAGKTTFLTSLSDSGLPESYEVRIFHVRRGNTPTTLTQDLLSEMRDAVGPVRALLNRITGASATGFGFGVGAEVDDRARHVRKLAEISDDLPDKKHLVLCIDDVQKLAQDDPELVRDVLRELADALSENVHLVSAGQIPFTDAEHVVELGMFSEEQTGEFLHDKFPDIDDERVEEIHGTLDGHPYYLGLLVEASDDEPSLEIRDDVYEHIEEQYLRTLSEEEEDFLRRTSPLWELNESLCTSVLEDLSRTQVRRILDSLRDKVIVRELDRSKESGEPIYTVHDLFRQFLYNRLDDPDEIHRAAFQHYAMELFETIRDSDIPPLEGFAFGMLANIHLQFIYDEGPSTEQIQEEIDRLELGPYERLRFVMGYAPYAPKVDEDEDDGFGYYSDLLVAEVDHYRDALADYEPENEADELELQVLLVLFDLLRAHLRSVGEDEFDSTSIEIYQDTLERVQSLNIASYFEEESEEAAHLIPDMLEVMCHIAIYNDSDDEGTLTTHLEGLYSVLDEYGLGQEPIEEFIDYCQEIRDEFQAGEQMEESVEDRLEEVFGDVEDDGLTRTALVQVQYDFLDEMKSLASSFATGLMTESNRLTDFILDCGESLAKAENPFFAAAWYAFATQIFRMFAPEAESTKELEEAFHEQAARRKEYEKQLDTPIVEMEEFEIGEFELPDVVDEIAARESNGKIFPEPDTDDKET